MAAPDRPIKIGLGVPDAEGLLGGRQARWGDLLFRQAPWQASDAPAEGVWECWSLLAALAAATTKVELGSMVTCAGFRNPALLAKMAATVDEISGGRLILGLGAGWHEPEYAAFGYPFDHRIARFEEALTIVMGLLRDGRVDFAGEFHQARDCELRPRGPRSGGPPIVVGTMGDRMLRLTARHADLWNGIFAPGAHRPQDLGPLLARVDAACAAEGREPPSLGRTFAVYVDAIGDAPPRDSVNVDGAEPLRGSAAQLAELFRGYADVGISHLQVLLHPMTIEGIERLAPVLGLLDSG